MSGPAYLRLNNLDLGRSTSYMILEIDDMLNLPTVESNDYKISNRHGSWIGFSDIYGPKIISVKLLMKARQGEKLITLRDDLMQAAAAPQGEDEHGLSELLIGFPERGELEVAWGRVDKLTFGKIGSEYATSNAVVTFQFRTERPYISAAEEVTSTITPGADLPLDLGREYDRDYQPELLRYSDQDLVRANQAITLNNGNWPTDPVIDVLGPVDAGWRITHYPSLRFIESNQPIIAGRFVRLDTFYATAIEGAVGDTPTNIYTHTLIRGSRYFQLPVGPSRIVLLGSGQGSAIIKYRSARI